MTPLTSSRLSTATLRVIDTYAEQLLGCPHGLARAGGIHLLSVPSRGLPSWHGYVLPIIGLAFAPGVVLACRPDLLDVLRGHLGSDSHLPYLDGPSFRRLLRAVQRTVPNSFTLAGDLRAVDGATFAPAASAEQAEHIPDADTAALHLRNRFDGPIFGVRGPRGRLISWAALKFKSEHVWEVAVATEADYRGRGYARAVVTAATRHALDQGRLVVYIHDRDNSTSAFVARALGYQMYAEIVFAEY